MKTRPTCVPLWREIDTTLNDQEPDSFEGTSALFDLRRMGFIPQEAPEPVFEDWSELCF